MSATVPSDRASQLKLILAVVSEPHSSKIVDRLVAANYHATLLSTTGGFMRRGNATLLIGVESDRVNDVFKKIALACAEIQARDKSTDSCATAFVLESQQNLKF